MPSLVAEIIVREVRKQLLGTPVKGKLNLLLPHRPLVALERVTAVPLKYRDLIGDHAPHPGEGRGRRAVRQLDVQAG